MQQYQRTGPRPPGPVVPEEFVRRIARPLHAVRKPSLTFDALDIFRTTVTKMDFATGEPVNSNQPSLLKLISVDYLRDFVCRVKPWIQPDGLTDFDNILPDTPKARDTTALA